MPEDQEPLISVNADRLKGGLLMTVIATVLGTGGSTALTNMIGYDDTKIQGRLDRIEDRLDRQEELQRETGRLTRIVYRTLIRADPEVSVPLEDLLRQPHPPSEDPP